MLALVQRLAPGARPHHIFYLLQCTGKGCQHPTGAAEGQQTGLEVTCVGQVLKRIPITPAGKHTLISAFQSKATAEATLLLELYKEGGKERQAHEQIKHPKNEPRPETLH